MLKGRYVLAIFCYLLIPAVVFAGAAVFALIDPEMALKSADYTRNYRLLDRTRHGVLMAAAALAFVIWIFCCYLVLRSRHRSLRWLALAAAGPLGFSIMATLEDRSPAPSDLYQKFIRNLKTYWRVPLEIAVFVAVWVLAYNAIVLERELMIRLESRRTGIPVATIVAQQSEESGMYAGSEGIEILYLVPLLYLLWPIVFNVTGLLVKPLVPRAPLRGR